MICRILLYTGKVVYEIFLKLVTTLELTLFRAPVLHNLVVFFFVIGNRHGIVNNVADVVQFVITLGEEFIRLLLQSCDLFG